MKVKTLLHNEIDLSKLHKLKSPKYPLNILLNELNYDITVNYLNTVVAGEELNFTYYTVYEDRTIINFSNKTIIFMCVKEATL